MSLSSNTYAYAGVAGMARYTATCAAPCMRRLHGQLNVMKVMNVCYVHVVVCDTVHVMCNMLCVSVVASVC